MSSTKPRTPRLRAVVHIGPIKTGSTAFTAQMIASQERGELGPKLVYAMPREVKRSDSTVVVPPEFIRYLLPKLEWSRQAIDEPGASEAKTDVFGIRAGLYLDNLAAELRSIDSPEITVVFVEEALSRRTSPDRLTAELLKRFDSVDYFFVARAQRFIVPSAISQRIKMRSYPKVWDYRVSAFLGVPNLASQFDYANVYERWAPKDKRVRLFAVPFLESDRGTQNLFYRILETVGISASLGEPVRRAINVTPSRFEIRAISLYKRATLRISRDGLPRGSARRRAFETMSEFFTRIARTVKSPRWEVTPSELVDIVEHYRAANSTFLGLLGASGRSTDWKRWLKDSEISVH